MGSMFSTTRMMYLSFPLGPRACVIDCSEIWHLQILESKQRWQLNPTLRPSSLSSVGSSGLFRHFTNELNLDDDSYEDVEVPIDPLLSLFDESAWLVDALPTFHILLTLHFKLSTTGVEPGLRWSFRTFFENQKYFALCINLLRNIWLNSDFRLNLGSKSIRNEKRHFLLKVAGIWGIIWQKMPGAGRVNMN